MASPLRFSLRTLAILVTLLCAYLACWVPTKRYAESRTGAGWNEGEEPYWRWRRVHKATAPLPLLVCEDQFGGNGKSGTRVYPTRYYVWLFGPKVMLYESEWK